MSQEYGTDTVYISMAKLPINLSSFLLFRKTKHLIKTIQAWRILLNLSWNWTRTLQLFHYRFIDSWVLMIMISWFYCQFPSSSFSHVHVLFLLFSPEGIFFISTASKILLATSNSSKIQGYSVVAHYKIHSLKHCKSKNVFISRMKAFPCVKHSPWSDLFLTELKISTSCGRTKATQRNSQNFPAQCA